MIDAVEPVSCPNCRSLLIEWSALPAYCVLCRTDVEGPKPPANDPHIVEVDLVGLVKELGSGRRLIFQTQEVRKELEDELYRVLQRVPEKFPFDRAGALGLATHATKSWLLTAVNTGYARWI